MSRRFLRLGRAGVWTLVAGALAVPLAASAPTFWTVSTQSEFLKGDVENLSIDADGRVFLGPETKRLADTSAPFIWTIVAASDGALWAGTGNEGHVLRVGKDGKATTIFDATEIEVHALAPAADGGMYVGTSPDGRIYRVAAEGKSTTFFDPDDKYIWALAVASDGTVYAATGEKGVIYRITPDGKGSVFYKTNSTNVVSLAIDRSGNLIAGTESPGRIFRIDREGKAFVLLDSPFKEIHAVRVAEDGRIYAAAFSGTPGGEDRPSVPISTSTPESSGGGAPVPGVTAEVTSITVVDAGAAAGATTPSTHESRARNAKGAIYRIRTDGLWDTVWEAMDDWPFDLLVEKDGSLLVGTGKEGKLFRISGEPARATLIARAAARQITSLVRDGSGRVVAATSNPGKLVAIASTRAATGTYVSDVRDAGTVATWGAVRWRASGKASDVQVFTRSGNTANPDDTWSPWSKAYTRPEGDPITSPNARYLQWRAVLAPSGMDPGPVLTSVTAAYLPRNLRPEVSSITVHPPGTVFQRPFSTGELEIAGFDDNTSDGRGQNPSSQSSSSSTPAPPSPALGRKVYQKGLQTFVWKADDDNDDRLQYDVYYRREGETTWRPLKRGLWDPIFVWDTTSVPDGTYYVKVAASDAPSNSPSTALTGELESVSFDIDNTAPEIQVASAVRSGTRAVIAFSVSDEQSPVERVEYSLDASRWQVAYPVDGIADSREEKFEVSVDGEAARVIIRASDAMNNVSTAVADVKKQ
jgi:sugar lactone lactonase YvrE